MAAGVEIPRIVIAATGSGAGKTTATVALITGLRARGLRVAPFKCGPDYLDPSYHARAAGCACHNLDSWMMGREALLATFVRAARNADIAVIEGMMGLFDGATPLSDEGSTAEIAKWLSAPMLLVVDASGMARTIAAVAGGFAHFDPALDLAGIICNRVGSPGHLELLRTASREVPVRGGLPVDRDGAFPERHLGLFSARLNAIPDAAFDAWARIVPEWIDLDTILAIARNAPPLQDAGAAIKPVSNGMHCRVGIASDDAFHFYYEYNLALLEAAGAELVRFSPVHDRALPEVDGLYFGGGYPELAARELSANQSMIAAVREFACAGGPIYAECGGLMYLARGIRTRDGASFPMAALIPADAIMHDRLQALGYVEVKTRANSMLGPAGTCWRGHQFRYSTLEPAPPAEFAGLYTVTPRYGRSLFIEGYHAHNLVASYVHAHWASNPAVATNFAASCANWRATR